MRGRAHVAKGGANQDAWTVRADERRLVVAVCDGLGSRPHSRMGARWGCRAAQSAAAAWCARPGAPWELFVRLLHAKWAMLVHPHAPSEAAATSLVGIARPGHRTLLAQLGDGLALIVRADGRTEAPCIGRDGFGNETTGLGLARSTQEWRILEVEPMTPGDALILATDGIADDLVPDRWSGLAAHLMKSCVIDGVLRSPRLRAQIGDWPVPHHTDDRTMVLCALRGESS